MEFKASLPGVQLQQQQAKAHRAERGGSAFLSEVDVSLVGSAEVGVCEASYRVSYKRH